MKKIVFALLLCLFTFSLNAYENPGDSGTYTMSEEDKYVVRSYPCPDCGCYGWRVVYQTDTEEMYECANCGHIDTIYIIHG